MKQVKVWFCTLALCVTSGSSALAQSTMAPPPNPHAQGAWTIRDLQLVRRYVNDHESLAAKGGFVGLSGAGLAYLGHLAQNQISGNVGRFLGGALQVAGIGVVIDGFVYVLTQGNYSLVGPTLEKAFGIPTAQAQISTAEFYKASKAGFKAFLKLPDEQAAQYMNMDPELAQVVTTAAHIIRHNNMSK